MAGFVEAPGAQRRPCASPAGSRVGAGLPVAEIFPRGGFAAGRALWFGAEADRGLAAQDRAGAGGQHQAAVAFGVGQQVALRDKLADHREPGARVEFGADAERLDPVVAEAGDALGPVADQHVGEVVRAETLAGAVGGG